MDNIKKSKTGKKKRMSQLRKDFNWFKFIIPILVVYLIFFIAPAISSIFYSFTKWDGVTTEFIGLENYIKLFQDKEILTTFGNTIFYTIGIVLLQNIVGLALAVWLKKSSRFNNILRTLVFMPYIFSPLLIGYVFKFIFEPNIGVVNSLLKTIHLGMLAQPWLTDPFVAKFIIVLVTVWQFAGYTMVINIAGLQNISEDYYEAAEIDGATKWEKFRHITFPLMAPATTINIMLSLIGNLQIFDQIYALTGGGPAYKTESIATTIYRLGFGSNGARWGYGSAMSVVLFIVMLILTIFTTTKLRKREVQM